MEPEPGTGPEVGVEFALLDELEHARNTDVDMPMDSQEVALLQPPNTDFDDAKTLILGETPNDEHASTAAGTSEALEAMQTSNETIYEKIIAAIKGAGGVRQYIHKQFPIRATRTSEITKILQAAIPHAADATYLVGYPLPVCFPGQESQQLPFYLPICENESSLREPPSLEASVKLLHNFCVDGFHSSSEPVLIRLEAAALPTSGVIEPGSIWYLKGALRIQTAIAAVVAATLLKLKVPELLCNTLQHINCQHVREKDRRSELFYNMKKSVRGAIRKSPSSLSWVFALINLSASGAVADSAELIKTWNDQAAKHDRIVGAKHQAVKNILAMPESCRNCILQTVSVFGWEGCPYTDDALSSKKTLVNFNHKAARTQKNSPWQNRVKNSEESLILLWKMIHNQWLATPSRDRRVFTKQVVEDKAEVTALACSVVVELAQQIPNVETMLETRFLKTLEHGDTSLEMDLAAACQSKDDSWVPRDNACILGILNDLNPVVKPGEVVTASGLQSARTALDEQTYSLLLEEVSYDEKCLAAFKHNLQSYELRMQHLRDTWTKKRIDKSREAATKFWDAKVVPHCWPEKFDGGTALGMLKEIEEDVEKWLAALKLKTCAYIFICNYSAPPMFKTEVIGCCFKLMGQMVASPAHASHACGVFLSPGYSYGKNKTNLFATEYAVLTTLSNTGCQCDQVFQLLFDIKSRVDQRDERPLAYQGRIILPHQTLLEKDGVTTNWLFRDSSLYRSRRTMSEAKQIPAKLMIIPEKVGDNELPSGAQTPLHGPLKYSQIGSDAAEKLLSSVVDGVDFGSQTGICVVDLTPQVGDFFRGYVEVEKRINCPMIYCPIFGDAKQQEWFDAYWSMELSSMFQRGELNVSNLERLEMEPRKDHLEQQPDPPTLKRCVYGKVDSIIATIEIPETVIKQWWDHPPFQSFLDDFTARNPTSKTLKQQSKGKAVAVPNPGGKTVSKRPRAEDLSRFLVSEAPGQTTLAEVALVNVRLGSGCTGLPTLVITDQGPFIKNSCGKAVTIPAGLILCGWGKGKFREFSKDKPVKDDVEVSFDAKLDTLAMLDSKFGSMTEILDHAKLTKPENLRLCYHSVGQEPNGEWKITQDHSIIFSVLDEEDGIKWSQQQVAKRLKPMSYWNTCATGLGWQLRWSLNGIQPQRPVVFVKHPIDIEDGKTFLLQSA